MKVIFLDIDGVLVNRESLTQHSGPYAKGHPDCVAALNRIIEETGALIVVSSTWRACGTSKMKDFLSEWGVRGRVLGCTPDLTRQQGVVYVATVRGDEIQAFITQYESFREPIESFVILDDDTDMAHLKHRLIKTEFAPGLTMEDAAKAISLLSSTD